MTKDEMLQYLHKDVVPALGCTEPVCVALASADAARAVGGRVSAIRVSVSRGIYKNGMSVGIPGIPQVGLHYAAALGACIAAPETGLEIFSRIDAAVTAAALPLAESGAVTVTVDDSASGVYVRSEVTTDAGLGVSVIQGAHTNIILTQANGVTLFEAGASGASAASSLPEKVKALTVSRILALATEASEEELAFLADGIEMNETLAGFCLSGEEPGIGVARTLKQAAGGALFGTSVLQESMLQVAAATEARLNGCPHATMSSAGSGSKGILAILPVVQTARFVGASREKTLQALAFTHLLNGYINLQIGKLSAVCACSVASGTAASAAITWLLGGSEAQIEGAIRNMTGSVTGMICDGGKVGCALKLSTATAAAFTSAALAVNGVFLRPTDGICDESAENCIRNIGHIANVGMKPADNEIIRIMLEKNQAMK